MMVESKRASIAGATAWSTSGALVRMALNFAGMVILARLVAPQAFGVFAVASSLVLLVAYLAEIGGSWALIQRKQIRPDHAGSALAIATGTAVIVSGALALMSGHISDFMRMPELQQVLLPMCLIIPVQAASGVPRALLRRRMNFARLVKVDLVAAVVGLACGLAHALAAPSVYSLLFQAITYQLVLAIGLWSKDARAALGRPSRTGLRELLAFAGGQTLYETMILVSKNLDTFLIARVLGAAPLGLYSRAFALIFTPLGQVYTAIGTVAFSAMARQQSNISELRDTHRKFLLGSVLGFALPLTVFSSFTTEFVVLVLGEVWRESAPVLSILALAAAVQVFYANFLWLLQATAQLKTQIRSGILLALVNVSGFAAAATTGDLVHFAYAYIAGAAVALVYVLRTVSRTVEVPVIWYFAVASLLGIGVLTGKSLHAALLKFLDTDLGVLTGLFVIVLTIALAAGVIFRRRMSQLMQKKIKGK